MDTLLDAPDAMIYQQIQQQMRDEGVRPPTYNSLIEVSCGIWVLYVWEHSVIISLF